MRSREVLKARSKTQNKCVGNGEGVGVNSSGRIGENGERNEDYSDVKGDENDCPKIMRRAGI